MFLSAMNVKLKNIWACKRDSYVQEFLRIHLFSSAVVAGGAEKAPTILLVIVLLLLAI